MQKRILIIQGHPDAGKPHYGHALAQAYREGAIEAGHQCNSIDVATLEFPLLRSKEEFDKGALPESIANAQALIRDADHLVLFYPLWLGSMPALLKGFLEQVFRPEFAFDLSGGGWKKKLRGKSARIVITMGMPAFFYRWYFRAHSLKSLERNILGFSGIKPIRENLIGAVEGKSAQREAWLKKLRELGRAGR